MNSAPPFSPYSNYGLESSMPFASNPHYHERQWPSPALIWASRHPGISTLPPLTVYLHQRLAEHKSRTDSQMELVEEEDSSSPISNSGSRSQISLKDILSEAPDSRAAAGKRMENCRQCVVADCYKYALSGGKCIRHGGGKRCSASGCETVAQSGGLCKAHGGGSRCKVPDCSNIARRRGFCMGHGGRQACKVASCTKCAHGGGYCIAHGGGKRCASLDCEKSAQAGGFCYSHGGGKRCSAPDCFQAARKGGYCIRHRKRLHSSVISPRNSQ